MCVMHVCAVVLPSVLVWIGGVHLFIPFYHRLSYALETGSLSESVVCVFVFIYFCTIADEKNPSHLLDSEVQCWGY